MGKLVLLILGGGNGPHCYSALAASLPDVEVRVLTLFQDEAERWTKSLEGPFEITFKNFNPSGDRILTSKPDIVSKDPGKVVPGSHLIVFMVPAFAHNDYFQAITPFLEPGMIICGLPGGGGFLFQALSVLNPRDYQIITFSTLPWACRITEFGKSATILAVKDSIIGGSMGTDSNTVLNKTPIETIEYTLLGKTKCIVKGHMLGDTLMYGNAYVHPSIEYGRWLHWDGKALPEPPDFYHGVTQLGADMINATSAEAIKIRDEITRRRPDIDLSQVINKYDWYCQTYSDEIVRDKSTLYSILRTNQGYAGIKHPMIKVDDGYKPNFQYRHFTEDIPCGQVVLRGMAEILGVETPNLDACITWAQGVMGKEYLVRGRLCGRDIGETRCPQRFGITTLEGMLGEI